MNLVVQKAHSIRGSLKVPGDKSIAHRALILGAMARGKQVVDGLPHAADVHSTISCLRTLGCFIEEMPDGRTLVLPRDLISGKTLDAGNSGTTARLLSGLIAGHDVECTIDGDSSLRKRPMGRIADPLSRMGAAVTTTPGGTLPMTIRGGRLKGITYRLPVPSAQVKSAVLIAGLLAEGETVVAEGTPSRDHTERLLSAMSAPIEESNGRTAVRGPTTLRGTRVKVPGDFSSAAFFVVAAACLPDSEVYLPGTGVNPTRTGLLRALESMGAEVELVNTESYGEEPVADLVVKWSRLRGTTIGADAIPSIIDELPILAVAATQAEGETIVTGAEELRHKESDRVAAIVENLSRLGADIEEKQDGFIVRGPCRLTGGSVNSRGDHRVAMSMAIAGLLAEGKTVIEQSDVMDVSYPAFSNDLRVLTR